MLVLARKTNEKIVIDNLGDNTGEVVITVVRAKCGRVWLAIDAPREVCICRSEVPRLPRRETLP